MAVAFDAATESSEWTTTPDPFTFNHTPSGTPRGVMVFVVQQGSAADQVSGITYGGTAMTRVVSASDSAAETGRAYVYFLGASVPTGTQTVSIDHTAGSGSKWACAVTVTAGGDTEVKDFDSLNDDQTNPQVSLDSGAAVAQRYVGLFSGLNVPSNATPISGMSAIHDNDFTNQSARVDRETSTSSGATSVGYTASAEDCALVALAIGEISGAITLAADAGSFTITGTTASLERNRLVSAVTGTFTISGTAASLEFNRLLSAGVGSYLITGTAANLFKGIVMSAVSGGFAITGTAAGLLRAYIMALASGSYTITGTAATLAILRFLTLLASSGAFVITGTPTVSTPDPNWVFLSPKR